MKTSHASIMAVVRLGEARNTIELLAFLYTSRSRHGNGVFTAWKFPTETGEPGETPWTAASNGMYRELSNTPDTKNPRFEFRCLRKDKDERGNPKSSWVYQTTGDQGKGYDRHDKHVFLITLDPGSLPFLRTEERSEGDGEILGAPEFIEAAELWSRMKERGQPCHRSVLLKILGHFACDQGIFQRYRSILENSENQMMTRSRGKPIEFVDVE